MEAEKSEKSEKSEKKLERKPALGTAPVAAQWKRAALMAKTVSAFKDTISVDSDDDMDTKQQIKYGSKSQAAWAIFSEYTDYSTIHGIKYLGEKKRPCLERFFWITVFVISIYTCATLTMNIWNKWNYNPVIVSFAEKSTPVWQIPFPAVTVCAETKSRQSVFNFTDIFWKHSDHHGNASYFDPLSNDEVRSMEAITQICEAHLMEGLDFGEKLVSGQSIIGALSDVTPLFNQTYLTCKWRNMKKTCEDLFYRFITEDGICYSYNSLTPAEIFRKDGLIADFIFDVENRTATEWNVEDGYDVNANPEAFPNRVLGPGSKAGLYLVLNGFEKDFDNLCRGPVQGFKILLHTPGEVAQMSKQYFRVPFDQEVLISVKPKIITTSEGLLHYEPHRRQCYFQKEKYLRYFQIYTQSNCELECVANFTLTKCGCVRFSMPRVAETPVCGAANIKCYNDAEEELLLKEFNQGLETSSDNARGVTECNCLPACTSINYEAEISQADFDYRSISNTFSRGGDTNQNAGSKMSRVSIFFKEAQFLTSRRSELYGTTDFLANIGGLLGLFMGVSTLSIVEILYFCSLRLLTNLKMRHKKRKEMSHGVESEKEA